jgi:hypothetical protein
MVSDIIRGGRLLPCNAVSLLLGVNMLNVTWTVLLSNPVGAAEAGVRTKQHKVAMDDAIRNICSILG